MSSTRTSPQVVGLTGRIASGKSTVAKEFKRIGAQTISADEVVKELYAENIDIQQKIQALCHPHNVKTDGQQAIDNVKLTACLIKSPHLLQNLENIVFPVVYKVVEEMLKNITSTPVVILEAPLIFKGNLHNLCIKTITCICPADIRYARAHARNGLKQEVFSLFETRQLPEEDAIQRCDYIIDTAATLAETSAQVIVIYNKINDGHA